jgi:uncharacterized membrane protein
MDVGQLARVEQLEQQVARLDQEVARLRTRIGDDVAPTASVTSAARRASPTERPDRAPWPPPRPIAAAPTRVAPERNHLAVDSEAVLKWGGVGLVVLAVGFAVSTAISRDWIGPELQLAGALAVSAAFVAAGLRLLTTRPQWTHALCSGGTLAFFTTFASDLFRDRAHETAAFAATAVMAAAGLVLARTIRSEWVAVSTLVGGSIAWAVIAGADDRVPFVATMVWFVVLVVATIALSVERRWFAARAVAHGIGMIAVLALSGEARGTTESALLTLASVVVVGSLFVVPSIGDLTSRWQQFEIQLAATAAPWAFSVALIAFLGDSGDRVISAVAFSMSAAAAALVIALRGRIRHSHAVSLGLGASVTISIGLAVLLSTTAVFVALAVQAAGLVLLSRALGRQVRVLVNAAILGAIAVGNTVVAMVEAWTENSPWGDDIAHLSVVVALAVGIWYVGERVIRRAGAIATLTLFLVWSGSVFVHLPQGQAVVSVVWATTGTVVLVTGAVRKRADVASAGLAVLALTVGKLLTVDLREVDTLWRAGLFFLVGIGLLRLGFLLPRLISADSPDVPSRDEPDQKGGLSLGDDS